MNNKPTPETDKAERMAFNYEYMVPTEAARRLERERDEAREDVRKLQDIKTKHEHEELVAAHENDCLRRERDEAREVLSEIALYLSAGMGDESTTASQYQDRILEGIKLLTDPMVQNWKEALKERDEAREKIKRQAERIRELEGATNHAGGL